MSKSLTTVAGEPLTPSGGWEINGDISDDGRSLVADQLEMQRMRSESEDVTTVWDQPVHIAQPEPITAISDHRGRMAVVVSLKPRVPRYDRDVQGNGTAVGYDRGDPKVVLKPRVSLVRGRPNLDYTHGEKIGTLSGNPAHMSGRTDVYHGFKNDNDTAGSPHTITRRKYGLKQNEKAYFVDKTTLRTLIDMGLLDEMDTLAAIGMVMHSNRVNFGEDTSDIEHFWRAVDREKECADTANKSLTKKMVTKHDGLKMGHWIVDSQFPGVDPALVRIESGRETAPTIVLPYSYSNRYRDLIVGTEDHWRPHVGGKGAWCREFPGGLNGVGGALKEFGTQIDPNHANPLHRFNLVSSDTEAYTTHVVVQRTQGHDAEKQSLLNTQRGMVRDSLFDQALMCVKEQLLRSGDGRMIDGRSLGIHTAAQLMSRMF